MSLSERLQPSNTLAAKTTAQNAFARFLRDEGMTPDEAHRAIKDSRGGRGLAVIMDKFAIFLAFGDGTKGVKLAMNTVNSYFSNVKLWLLGLYPDARNASESELQIVGSRLSKYCKKRIGGQIIKKAPACRKIALAQILRCVYTNAATSSDYMDGLLLSWLWYLFGRSSDLCGVQISSITLYPGGALSVRFRRQKTADECGLTLFRDKTSCITCPTHGLALALAMKSDKSNKLFNQLPSNSEDDDDDRNLLSIPLRDLLSEAIARSNDGMTTGIRERPMNRVAGVASPAIHGYVNRLIANVHKLLPANTPREDLSSHSFRRGGAQHANGNSGLSPQWILDRGSWNMSATNKGFVYIMNTTQEDQRVAKYLSGWSIDARIVHTDLTAFDGAVLAKIRKLSEVLFSGCSDLDTHLRDVLTASILHNYPAMVTLQGPTRGGILHRIHECMKYCGVDEPEFLAWHSHLAAYESRPRGKFETARQESSGTATDFSPTSASTPLAVLKPAVHGDDNFQQIVTKLLESNQHLCESNRLLSEQVQELRGLIELRLGTGDPEGRTEVASGGDVQPLRVRKAAKKRLRDVWIEWRTILPPRWDPTSPFSRQERHDYKMAVAYMSIFLVDGYDLDPAKPSFQADVFKYGELAEMNLVRFLRDGNISASSLGTIVKAMRELYNHGELNSYIEAHAILVRDGRVHDHLPRAYHADVVLPVPRAIPTIQSHQSFLTPHWP